MFFEFALFAASLVGGGVASLAGFGIGSLVTPVLSLGLDTKVAVAAVSIPHFVGTALRFWMLRSHVNRPVLLGFGLMSAGGGLLGAFLHSRMATPALTLVFGGLLLFVGLAGLSGLARRMRFYGRAAWLAGGVSGVLGGLVGNQGGIRSAALLGFAISKESFVATATAIGLLVDLARMPVYFWSQGDALLTHGGWLACSTLGVILGTVVGNRLLKRIPERFFQRGVSALILTLGAFMLMRGLLNSSG